MSAKPSTTGTVRAVFLDVDGTYADYGVVPEGHVRAVRAAREAGHRVLLCTGRPVSMLPDSILAAGFDGLVASAGAYVEVAGTVLVDRRFPADLAGRTVRALDAHDAVYVLEAQEALHVPPVAMERLRAILDAHFRQAPEGPVGSSAILDAVHPTADRAAVQFAKVSVFDSPVAMERLVKEIGGAIAVVANSVADEGRHAGELYQREISKADGVAAVIAHLGIAREATIAIGDGANDLEMIAYAGIGIAIEGSHPELMAIADRVAARPRQEGLVAAFAELGLL
ncbi:Cof subfamily protein (haloacid dehalogenase superfamily) [Arthrobacter sp. V4I6]|uniref:HAD-IIB family hydrolase n=1 Tax=unclassified Arthrobacter TaxID=235627 RepID=UPI0027858E07|nr:MULTISPECIES: HAD-IIB family hydrolase [unclassified Arthrobacter]MDQ0819545.1 Cof subfamily protein (haloacid dehalogenase superfamily) [Arthrobacter sp. V1I7]MDQ0853726.1 Cof subfamily protein (haloacid dehalogenase superfamily) [Arthrobacter sp. V4I6]